MTKTRPSRPLSATLSRASPAFSASASTATTRSPGLSMAAAMPMVPIWAPMSSIHPDRGARDASRYSSQLSSAIATAASFVSGRVSRRILRPPGVANVENSGNVGHAALRHDGEDVADDVEAVIPRPVGQLAHDARLLLEADRAGRDRAVEVDVHAKRQRIESNVRKSQRPRPRRLRAVGDDGVERHAQRPDREVRPAERILPAGAVLAREAREVDAGRCRMDRGRRVRPLVEVVRRADPGDAAGDGRDGGEDGVGVEDERHLAGPPEAAQHGLDARLDAMVHEVDVVHQRRHEERMRAGAWMLDAAGEHRRSADLEAQRPTMDRDDGMRPAAVFDDGTVDARVARIAHAGVARAGRVRDAALGLDAHGLAGGRGAIMDRLGHLALGGAEGALQLVEADDGDDYVRHRTPWAPPSRHRAPRGWPAPRCRRPTGRP